MTKERIEELLDEFRDAEQDDVATFHELYSIASELLDKLTAAEERDRWVLVSERLPEHMARVEFIPCGAKRYESGWFYQRDEKAPATFGTYLQHFVFCWRPARPVGELPIPKEET